MTVWIYVDTSKQVGDRNHLKVFSNEDADEKWFAENDPEGVAFEYPIEGAWRYFCGTPDATSTRRHALAKAARRAVCEFRMTRVGPDHPLGPLGMAKTFIPAIRGGNPPVHYILRLPETK